MAERVYSGVSAATRVAARRRLLLDAAFARMAEDDGRGSSIDQLCRDASLNKRYFYESFADLTQLEHAVVDELAAQLLAIGLEAANAGRDAGHSTEQLSRATMTAVLGYLVEDPRRARVLFGPTVGGQRAAEHRKATVRWLARELAKFGHVFHGATSSEPVAEVAAALLIGGSMEVVLSWLDGDIAMSLDQLVDYLAGLWVILGDGAVALARRAASR